MILHALIVSYNSSFCWKEHDQLLGLFLVHRGLQKQVVLGVFGQSEPKATNSQ
jgi:hypothetical protein